VSDENAPSNQVVVYQAENGKIRVEVRFEQETVWLSQAQLADLYQTTAQNITQHIREIYDDEECDAEATCKEYLQVRREGNRDVRRSIKHYNLAMILAIGFRVRSPIGSRFRQWASDRLQEYALKGFTLDDDRLKAGGGGLYFEELLERIRDIRSSEKVFWRQVLDIYATSIDYDPRAEASQEFFKTIQNKMHWAVHGHTAAELIFERIDADKPNLGLTTWSGREPRKSDLSIAKNYLNEEELGALNRIVMAYLEFAELQALNRKPMTMVAWIAKLDDFLKLSDRDILTHAGKISHQAMLAKAEEEYQQFKTQHIEELSPVERDFLATTKKLKKIVQEKPHD
jgi:hypothetical protein